MANATDPDFAWFGIPFRKLPGGLSLVLRTVRRWVSTGGIQDLECGNEAST
jgi:hypothetical protein